MPLFGRVVEPGAGGFFGLHPEQYRVLARIVVEESEGFGKCPSYPDVAR
jgi:hypothetical protein